MVVHELDLKNNGYEIGSAEEDWTLPTSVRAGKSRAHLSGGVLQIAAVMGCIHISELGAVHDYEFGHLQSNSCRGTSLSICAA